VTVGRVDASTRVVTFRAMSNTNDIPKLLSYDDIAAITGYSVNTLRHMKMSGNFPATCGPGRRVLVAPSDLQMWLDANRKAS